MAEIWSAYREGRIVADVVIKPDGTYRLLPRDPHFLTKSYKTKQAALKALSQYGDVPTEYETVTPEGIKEFEILNMRGQRFGNRTFGTIEEANRFLEKKITAPPARLQFLIQEVKLGVAIPKAAPEIPDPDKDLYFGEKEKLALSMIGSPKAVTQVNIKSEVTSAYKGQINGRVTATNEKGTPIGALDYQQFGDEVLIAWIGVTPDYQHQGIAKKLYEALQKEWPDKKIQWGMTTPEGTALRKSIEEED